MSERARWSHSKLVKLARCGEQFRRDEVDREYAPPTSSMVRGTVVHAVAADSHTRQLAGKAAHPDRPKSMVLRESLPGEDEAADLAATRFEYERKTNGIAIAEDDNDAPAPKVIGREKDSAVRMSRYFVTRVAPFVDPIAVEQKLVVEPKDSDIRVSGILDLVTVEPPLVPGGPQRRGVRDYKTSQRSPNSNEADTSEQLSMYALLDSLATGSIADVFALDYVVEDPRQFSGPPYRVSLESTRTDEDVRVIVEKLNVSIDAVKAGVFLPAPPNSWWCSSRFCRHWASCKFVSKARR
jgi:hypothetical protein